MWSLQNRVKYFTEMFNQLQATTSTNEKRDIVDMVPEELKSDWHFMLKVMGGHKPLGYTAYRLNCNIESILDQSMTIEKYLEPLWNCARQGDWSTANIQKSLMCCPLYQSFYIPLVNREYRLGIGNSLIEKTKLSPMLAKKFEGVAPHSDLGYFVTEKLDGNRCIAWHDGERWNYTSRNGKPMTVEFDMDKLDKRYIYDGEVLSRSQTYLSDQRYYHIRNNITWRHEVMDEFNKTAGMIARKTGAKDLIYNIFDIIEDDMCYVERRTILTELDKQLMGDGHGIRIVPTLAVYRTADSFEQRAHDLMDTIVKTGGEGIMINIGDAQYINKRTDQLLKYKPVHTLDMVVVDWIEGFGKYQGAVGSLICTAMADGKTIWCNVGTGLNDLQRFQWAKEPLLILGKIVEVHYFSISQGEDKSQYGEYSLRFPRLKGVRHDKSVADN